MVSKIFIVALLVAASDCRNDCVTMKQCLKSIAETNDTFVQTTISYWQKRLHLDETITHEVQEHITRFNVEVSTGLDECLKFFLDGSGEEYSNVVQLTCYNDTDKAPEPPREVEEYFSKVNHLKLKELCESYVSYLNEYCDFLENGLNVTGSCNVRETFEQIYKKPWSDCMSSDSTASKK